MDAGSAAAASAAVDSDAGTGGTQQLGAFDAPPQAVLEEEPHASPAYQDSTDEAASPAPDADEPALAEVEPIPPAAEAAAAAAAEADASPDDEPDALDSVAPMPAFLAARSARPNQPPPKVDDKITREEVVPSWELTDRYGAQSGGGMRDHVPSSDGAFSKILTAVAVVIILAIGVAAVVLIPGLLNGPAATTRPTLALASRTPSSTVVAGVATPTAAAATPTATAQSTPEVTPGPTPRTYRVKSGDTLAKIARRFRITVPALVAANPELTNADHIEVGQVLIIPPRQPN
jgi:LysM repeat protein